MITLYRAMNDEEFKETMKTNSLSWRSKFKWFGTREFVKNRVLDGKFAKSNLDKSKYKKCIEFVFDSDDQFQRCGRNEWMLNIRKRPLVRLISMKEISL